MSNTFHKPNGANPEVIELIRFSTAEQASEGRSGVERQHSINVNAAAHHGLRIRRTIEAVDVSGRHVADDPQFQALFAELKDPTLAGVLVAEQSRIFRPDAFGDYAILDHFAQNKKLIWTPTGVIDPTTTEGRTSLVLNGMMSGEELRKIRERTMSGKAILRKQGANVCGAHMLPRGVRYIKECNESGKVLSSRWAHDGVDSERIRRAFELLFAGVSFQEIARQIGGGWSGKGIRDAMMNPIWIGVRRYMYSATGAEVPVPGKPGKFKRRLVRRETPLDVKIDIEPIITEAAFKRAQDIIAGRMATHRKSKLKNTGRPRFLANGIAKCACGAPLYGKYGSRKVEKDRYACSGNCGAPGVRRTELDGTIETLIIEQLLAADFLLGILSAALELAATVDPTRAAREAKFAKLESGRAALLVLVRDGDLSREEFKVAMAANEAERRSLAAMLPAPAPAADPAVIVERFARAFGAFATLADDDKRAVLQAGIKEIILDGRARTVPSVTLNGGYLGGGVNSDLRSRASLEIDSVPDVVVKFPQPVLIPVIKLGSRKGNPAYKISLAKARAAIAARRAARQGEAA